MDHEQLRAAAISRNTPRDPEGPGHPLIDTASVEATSTGTVHAAAAAGTVAPATAAQDALPLERRVALRNCGRIDPGRLEDYVVRAAGYSGLDTALKLRPLEVIEVLRRVGLRGRGGAGYPTAEKWRACHDAASDEKYFICNGVDADPQARTGKTLFGCDPHAVLEGLLIGAYAVGAVRCFVCVGSDCAEEATLLGEALAQMQHHGLLGEDILGSGFSCDIHVREIAPSLVIGEETALIRALEGRQPLPYLRFDHPAVKGLNDKPTLVNSAETLANVSAVFQGQWLSGQHDTEPCAGPSDSATDLGTKVITVCGDGMHARTVEVPLGTTMRALLEAVRGEAAEGETPVDRAGLKAVQFGGPTGAFFTGTSLETPISYEDLESAGAPMGSASLHVFGSIRAGCAVEIAHDVMDYLAEQSCGKCVVCREGTYQLADMLAEIAEGRARTGDKELLFELCEAMKTGSICGLGKTAPIPLLTLMRLFPDDFAAHLEHGRCPGTRSTSGRDDGG